MENVLRWIAILAMVLLNACSLVSPPKTLRGEPAEAVPPQDVKSVAEVPKNQFTSRYKIIIYPGTGKNFNPSPTLTKDELDDVTRFDWYCAKQAGEMEGELKEMFSQGAKYGGTEGVLGAIGYRWGFGSFIRPADYLKAIGLVAFGGGLASGEITFEMAVSVLQGYCMTGMIYKADQLEGKLSRLWIVPLYVGGARIPPVSEKPAPTYPKARSGKIPPPLR